MRKRLVLLLVAAAVVVCAVSGCVLVTQSRRVAKKVIAVLKPERRLALRADNCQEFVAGIKINGALREASLADGEVSIVVRCLADPKGRWNAVRPMYDAHRLVFDLFQLTANVKRVHVQVLYPLKTEKEELLLEVLATRQQFDQAKTRARYDSEIDPKLADSRKFLEQNFDVNYHIDWMKTIDPQAYDEMLRGTYTTATWHY